MPDSAPDSQNSRADHDRTAIDTLRFLAVDMVERANSGHPGAPMGLAPLAYLLWTRHLRHDPATPNWPNRDRFVLSCGHASALIYGLLHLAGFPLSMEELKNFRQFGSKTPGHPENFHTAGVETTTGPLGQGLSTAVGMAIAEQMLGARFNRPGFPIIDHRTWVIASDGDLMEGITHEACSYAGHLRLGKLNVFYDDNRITIDGSTDLTFTEDAAQRYESYGWHVQRVDDGNDLDALEAAAQAAEAETDRPSLVIVRTHIGFGSPNKQDTAKAHGAPLGPDEVRLTKEALGWPLEPTFHVPDEAREAFAPAAESGGEAHSTWHELIDRYRSVHSDLASAFESARDRGLPAGWHTALPSFSADDGPIATRKASGKVLNALAAAVPQLAGGSADLAGSNNTMLAGEAVFGPEHPEGRNFHFGVREHAMGAVLNGMALSGMLRPYGGTFLIFSDYMRPAMRLGALMGVPAIYVLTHDSIFLGEDGPTHQPISQLLSLRSIPNFSLIRPADARETAQAWRMALEQSDRPTALALTRQGLPVMDETAARADEGVPRGAYVLADESGETPDAILIATGSEVSLALEAHKALKEKGIDTRLVSMPSWDLFDAQDADYRESVLPKAVTKRLAIEAGTTMGWERYVGLDGDVLGMTGFGASAPAKDLAEHFGFTVDNVIARVERLLS